MAIEALESGNQLRELAEKLNIVIVRVPTEKMNYYEY